MAFDPRFIKRSPLDSWKRALSTSPDIIQPTADAFTTERILAYDWKLGFPASLRVYSIVQIAEALQDSSSSVRRQDPTALVEADSIEHGAYEASTTDCSYLTRIIQYLQKIRRPFDERQGLDAQSQQPDPKFMPTLYYCTQPISQDQLIARLINMSKDTSTQLSEIQNVTRSRKPNEHRGPLQDLLQRHREITKCIEKFLRIFLAKYKIPEQMKRIEGQLRERTVTVVPTPPLLRMANTLSTMPIQSACEALVSSLRMLTKELEELLIHPQDFNIQIKYIEDLYSDVVMQRLKKFVKDITDIDLDKLEYRKVFVGVTGPQLLENVKIEHGKQVRSQMEQYYREICQKSDVLEGGNSQGHSTAEDVQLRMHTRLISETLLPEQQPHHFSVDN